MGFTRDGKLAAEVRNLRDSLLTRGSSLLSMKRSLGILGRTVAHEGSLYGLMRKMKQARFPRKKKRKLPPSGLPRNWSGQENLSSEWVSPSTYLDRRLALYNLERADHYYLRRVNLARRYHENFEGVAGMARPEISEDSLSHYTIRVKSIPRKVIREYLWKLGIDVGALFGFPAYLPKDDYPNASRMASEILNLPLDANLSVRDVDRISEGVKRALKASEGHAFQGQIGTRYSAA